MEEVGGDGNKGSRDRGSERLHIARSYTSLGVVVDLCTWKQLGEKSPGYTDAEHNFGTMPFVYQLGVAIRRAGTMIAGHGSNRIRVMTVDT